MQLCKTILVIYLGVAIVSCTAKSNPIEREKAASEASGSALLPAAQGDSTQTTPALPAVTLDTTYAPTAGRKIQVAGGEAGARNFQAALDRAEPGEVILLEAGASFTGNFTLPKKASTAGWITIRSSAPDAQLPAAGTRATPNDAARFAKLLTPNADPVIQTAAGAHHYRFIGIEFTVAPATTITYDLIRLGSGSQTSLNDVAHDLILDRCYLHGNATVNLRRGIALNSARSSVIDSYISECHEQGADSQAIGGWNGPGPFKIANNYLEGAGENVMFGGADPKIANLVPADIEFRHNHCVKPLAWKKNDPGFAGRSWSVKNLFELKNARRVLVDGNIFENNWVDAQNGFSILLTVRNQDGTAPWSVVEDVTFTNNVVRHVAAAINILGRDNNNESQQVQRIKLQNNLFYDVGGKQWGGNGAFLQISETRNVTVDHNTVIHKGNIINGHGVANEAFVFTNNLLPHNEYGVIGDGVGPGNATLSKYFSNLTFKKNAIAGGRSTIYPPDNFFPATLEDIGKDGQQFSLSPSSSLKKAGTDGRDIGCDLSALEKSAGTAELKI